MSMELTLPRTQFPLYEHRVRSKLDDLISRVFSAPFAKVFSSPIASPGAAVANPWYLSGGIAAANCRGAYAAKGAASLAASYTNLANAALPLTEGIAPTWDVTTGWYSDGTKYLLTGINTTTTSSIVVRCTAELSPGSGISGHMIGASVVNHYGILALAANYGTYFIYAGNVYLIGFGPYSGCYILTPTAAYIDGVKKATVSGTNNSSPISIFCRGAGNSFGAGYITHVAEYNIAIDSYVSELTTAINAL